LPFYSWSLDRACRKPSHLLSLHATLRPSRGHSPASFCGACAILFWRGRENSFRRLLRTKPPFLVQLHALLAMDPSGPDRLVDCVRIHSPVPLLKFLVYGMDRFRLGTFPSLAVIVDWIPPCLSGFFVLALSHPVQEKLRGLKWTITRNRSSGCSFRLCRRSIHAGAVLTDCNAWIRRFPGRDVWFVAAFVVRLVAGRSPSEMMGTRACRSLTTGGLPPRLRHGAAPGREALNRLCVPRKRADG